MTRLDIPTGMAFDAFCDAFESLAPLFDSSAIARICARDGSWEEVCAAMAANAPNDLMIFASMNAAPLLAVAGYRTCATEYFIGNQVIAETMIDLAPLALLYAPLRLLVHGDRRGEAVFSLYRPSTTFASVDDPKVTQVGLDLDRQIVELLALIGVDAAAAFAATTP